MRTVQADFPDTEEQWQRRSRDEEAVQQFLVLRRAAFSEREADFEDDLRVIARKTYQAGSETSWQQLLRAESQLDTDQQDYWKVPPQTHTSQSSP